MCLGEVYETLAPRRINTPRQAARNYKLKMTAAALSRFFVILSLSKDELVEG